MDRYALRLILAFALLGLTLTSTGAMADNVPVLPPGDTPFGRTYSEWAAAWWRWAAQQPVSTNPILDTSGEFCANNQVGPVWFLAGFSGTVTRSCTVPKRTALLFPVVNFIACVTPQSPPKQSTEAFLRERTTSAANSTRDLRATIDGTSVSDIQRLYFEQSVLFDLALPRDNIFGRAQDGIVGPCADAGYYLIVPPLSPGEHTIQFSGSLVSEDFSTDVTYHITVSNR